MLVVTSTLPSNADLSLAQSPDLAERSLESLFFFHAELLPKYAPHIESLFLMQNADRLVEEEGSSFQSFASGTEAERTDKVVEAIESVTKSAPPKDGSVRERRARSLLLAEIVKACSNLVKIEFDCVDLDEDEEEEAQVEARSATELEDYVLSALKQHANAFKGLSHIGYTLTPVSTSSCEDAAALISTYSTQLRSLRLDCASPSGDPEALLNALLSLEHLESFDLADSDFGFDFARLDVKWPLRRLVLGEFLELSTERFASLVNRFSSTLEILNLDGCPTHDDDDGEEVDAKVIVQEYKDHPVALPKLRQLEISTNDPVNVLSWLTSSSPSFSELRVGFCPNFDIDETVSFLEKNQEKIKFFELDVSCFGLEGMEAVEKLDGVCQELGIEFMLVSSGLDDDFMGGEFDVDSDEDDEEWEDEE